MNIIKLLSTYINNVKNPEKINCNAFDDSHDRDEGCVEECEPADGLGVDDIENVFRDVELDSAEVLVQRAKAGFPLQHFAE